MSDALCPYCGHEQSICHDDGYGYEEGARHEQGCSNCGREFEFLTSIVLDYEIYCKGDHEWCEWRTFNGETYRVCSRGSCEATEFRVDER